jgi:hypothetical protein
LAETDSKDGSKSVCIYCRASNMRDVSNLIWESSSEESATVTMSPRHTRSSSQHSSALEPVQEK